MKGNNMKNKLLLSTAIASVAFAGFASAETKVGGNLEQTFNALSSDTAQTSARSFGAEHNISLSSSKDLDNGLTAKYGFTAEGDSAFAADSHYLTIGTDTVAVAFRRDSGINLSSSAVPYIGDQFDTAAFTGLTQGSSLINDSDVHDNDHVAIEAKVMGGTVALQYAPDIGNGGADDSDVGEGGNSATGLIYSGSLGVDGLKLLVGKTKTDGEGATDDTSETQYGFSYNFGQFTVGAEKSDQDVAGTDTDTVIYGAAFAVNDRLTVGAYLLDSDQEGQADDEESKMLQVGYNLGGLGITVSYVDNENVGYSNGADSEQLQIHTVQKF